MSPLADELLTVKDWEDAIEQFFERGWTDGLPVVPPTPQRVEAMLAAVADRDPDEIVGRVPPRWAAATVRLCAINAVMAGCRPEYMPVVLAAIEAVCDERFNLGGVQATTHVCAPLIVVNGPIRDAIGLNSGYNVFGQGFRANATIGRALRLVLINVGGGIPGDTDQSTFGHPGKFTYCIAENEAASPWPPYHVERGFDPATSTVAVFPAEAPHSVTNHVSNDAFGIGLSIADAMSTLGSNNTFVMGEVVVVISPEHAATFRKDGWTKEDLRLFLYQKARNPMRKLQFDRRYGDLYNRNWPRWFDRSSDDELVPVVVRPDDIHIFVAGGPAGRFSIVIPGWGRMARSVIKPIRG